MKIKNKQWALLILLALLTTTTMAQDKLFSLEDLNFGGMNYRKMSPENQTYCWWGDVLIHLAKDALKRLGLVIA